MRISIALALLLAGGVAEAASVPLPRPRPAAPARIVPLSLYPPLPSGSFLPYAPVPREAAPVFPPGDGSKEAAARPSACQTSLKAVAIFTLLPQVDGAGACGIADPVSLEAAILRDGTHVVIEPPATLRCEMAAAVVEWVRDDMAPAAGQLGAALRGIENYDSYSCRSRNRVAGAKLSEHGLGNALDIKSVTLADGMVARFTDPQLAKHVRADVRKSACARFTTVLGPGSDGYHEHHVHVDLAQRRSGYRLCHWDVRDPLIASVTKVVLPRPRPKQPVVTGCASDKRPLRESVPC